MFKKVFQSFSKVFRPKTTEPPVSQTIRSAPPSFTGLSGSRKKNPAEDESINGEAPAKAPSPETLCGINLKMPKYEIRKRLAVLYRRYNRAASSLDASMRAESERMLDAIVKVREKYFDPL